MEQIERWGQEWIAMAVMPDHGHRLIGCDPQVGIHRLIKVLKGYSSHTLRLEYPSLKKRLPSLWTNSYVVATVGGVTLETVKRYGESQKDR
jgi:putative transposase